MYTSDGSEKAKFLDLVEFMAAMGGQGFSIAQMTFVAVSA